MFTQKPIVHRSSWHYKFWEWTFYNWLWKKRIPEQRSICAYWQRLIWIGLFTIALHAVVLGFRLVFKTLLYDVLVKPFIKSELLGALAVAIIFAALAHWYNLVPLMGFPIVFICAFAVLILIVFGVVALIIATGLSDILEDRVGPVIARVFSFMFQTLIFGSIGFTFRFLWQVFRRHYVIHTYRLADKDYEFNHRTPQILVHVFFWVLISGLGYLCFKGITLVTDFVPQLGITFWFHLIIIALCMWALMSIRIVLHIDELERESYKISMHSYYQRKRRGTYIASDYDDEPEEKQSGFWKTVESFLIFLKARKEKVCPLIQFVD